MSYVHENMETLADQNVQGSEKPASNHPTVMQLSRTRAVRDHIPPSAWILAVVQLIERSIYYGTSIPFRKFISSVQHDLCQLRTENYIQYSSSSRSPRGALGLGQSSATAINYSFKILVYSLSLPIAVVADSRIGRSRAVYLCAGFVRPCHLLQSS